MLEFTYDEVKKYLLGVIVFTAIYLLVFYKKGKNKSMIGYMNAIKSCIVYAVIGVFFVVGIGIIKLAFEQLEYMALLIPLGWLLIIYLVLKECLKNDFDLNISLFNLSQKQKDLAFNIIVRGIIALGFAFASGMIFIVAVPDLENQPYGPIPLVIAGVLFGGVAILLAVSIYNMLFKKNKNSKSNKFNIKSILYIFLSIFILFALLFLSVGIMQIINNNEVDIWLFVFAILFIVIPILFVKGSIKK